MSEFGEKSTPTQDLNEFIKSIVEDNDVSDAVEMRLISESGAQFWVRSINETVQQILCTIPPSGTEVTDIQSNYSLELGADGQFVVTTSSHVAAYSPSNPESMFDVAPPKILDHRLACDLMCELDTAQLVDSDLDDPTFDGRSDNEHRRSRVKTIARNIILYTAYFTISSGYVPVGAASTFEDDVLE